MIFQEPMTSLNPAYTIGSQMAEVLERHRGVSRAAALDRAAELLGRVGITAPGMRLGQYPHQLSGGLRQRVMIAMALMCDPELLIADEPTTALDVTVQAQILRLLQTLQRELGLALLLITHDLGIVARMADRVLVMYAGEVVESAPAAALFAAPTHPYTRGLLRCIPVPGSVRGETHRWAASPAWCRASRPTSPAAPSATAAPTPSPTARATVPRQQAGAAITTISAACRPTGRAPRLHDPRGRGRATCGAMFRIRGRHAGAGPRGARGRWRVVRAAGRRRAWHRRRVRLRQIDPGAHRPRPAAAERGRGAGRRPQPRRRWTGASARG